VGNVAAGKPESPSVPGSAPVLDIADVAERPLPEEPGNHPATHRLPDPIRNVSLTAVFLAKVVLRMASAMENGLFTTRAEV
jgi:hypothetical protein